MVVREQRGREEEEKEEGDNNNSFCESFLKGMKQTLKVKSMRRAIGFGCLIYLVYSQQINVQNFDDMAKVLNMTLPALMVGQQ